MGYQPDPANNPSPPLDNYDNASETSPPLEEAAGLETRAPADPAQDGPGIYSWDKLDDQGRPVRRAPRAAGRDAEPGAASTYTAGYNPAVTSGTSDRQA